MMDIIYEKLWKQYPSWFERSSEIRSALLHSIALALAGMIGTFDKLRACRWLLTAPPTQFLPGYLDKQLSGHWRIFWIDPLLPMNTECRIYRIGDDLKMLFDYHSPGDPNQAPPPFPGPSPDVPILPPPIPAPEVVVVPFNGPGLYRFTSSVAGMVMVIVGEPADSDTEAFRHIAGKTKDFLFRVAYEKGYDSTIPSGAELRGDEVFREMAKQFVQNGRLTHVDISAALAYYTGQASMVSSAREDWTSQLYARGSFDGQVYRVGSFANYINPTQRDYQSAVWKRRSGRVGRIQVTVGVLRANEPEIANIIEQYKAAGIVAEIR